MTKFRIGFKEEQKTAKTVDAAGFDIRESFVVRNDEGKQIYAVALESVFSIERKEEN